MNEKLHLSSLLYESRARVYALWAAIVGVGYVSTHYYQNANINAVWTVLSVIGFAYMYKVMPLRVKQMKHIYTSWLVPILIGIAVSVVSVRTDLLPELVGYLGAFWLLVQAAAFFWNGLVDGPGLWYYIVAGVNFIGAAILYSSVDLLIVQYLLVAIISVWSMLMLLIFRGDG